MTLKEILQTRSEEPLLPMFPRIEPRPARTTGPEWLAAAAFLFVVATGCVMVVLALCYAIFKR